MNYLSYTLQIHDYLMELKRLMLSYSSSPQVSTWLADIERLNEKLENMRFQVAVVGEFKRGKTSFINALLRKQILPADVLPATATINRITYGNEPSSYIYWNNSRPAEKIEIDQLTGYITKLTDSSAMQARNIKEAVVRYPCRFCENNVDLIDTPGMNDDEAMNSVTISQLSDIDLAIVTLDPNSPVSNTESHFIAKLVESDQICEIVFVVSKMDTVSARQRERLLKVIENRLQDLVRGALLETYDEKDPIMEKYTRLFAKPVIFPVSNTNAFYAYEMGDQQAFEDSGFQQLNEELLPLIIRTQHSAAILTPLNTITRVSREFIQLLQVWAQWTIGENNLLAMKKSFAETAYGLNPDNEKIWSGCIGRLDQLRNKRSDAVSAAILNFVRQYRAQTDTLVAKMKELFQSLNAELAQEERDSYLQTWYEYLAPKYVELCQRLEEIVRPFPKLLQQIEPELKALVNCASLLEISQDPEPFFWEISPLPPGNVPPGQLAYLIDNAVRTSFVGYYRRRQSRLAELLHFIIEEQKEKTATLVQRLFLYTKSFAPASGYIRIENKNFKYLSGQFDGLVQRCNITRENYIKESNNKH